MRFELAPGLEGRLLSFGLAIHSILVILGALPLHPVGVSNCDGERTFGPNFAHRGRHGCRDQECRTASLQTEDSEAQGESETASTCLNVIYGV